MSTPPPPPEAPAGSGDDDWRHSVLQSYRNSEVREIAKVLAALEPGATTSSKLMLAMRFEDAIFKSASSLADYRKRMTKRLKKLQKNYVPPAPTNDASGGGKANDSEVLLLELRRKYGEALKYIVKYASAAVKDVEERSGEERAKQLQQHTDSAVQWAKELGIWEEAPVPAAAAAAKVSEAHLQKLQQHLERRVDNIRTYVVKHADPDLFLQEALEKKDQELTPRANKMMAVNLMKRVEQLQQSSIMAASTDQESSASGGPATTDPSSSNGNNTLFDPMAMLQQSLEKAQATVPPPTRNTSNDVPAALMHLDKMRAASTAIMTYFCLPDRKMTAPRNALPKILTVVNQGMDFVKQAAEKLPKPTTDEVTLQDAWTKVLELPPVDATIATAVGDANDPDSSSSSSSSLSPLAKKPKLSSQPPVTKSRVLLTPHRKTPSHLVPALRRKRAILVRPPHGSRGSHLMLEFGKAFTMTIYFSPLLVSIRAMEPDSLTNHASGDATVKIRPIPTTTQLSTKGCASWDPLYRGLTHRQDLAVWGVTEGSYESVGRVVEERLRDASLHATHILRKCFRNHVKDKTTEFEVEILEASALLEFLQITRTTYMPNWQDED